MLSFHLNLSIQLKKWKVMDSNAAIEDKKWGLQFSDGPSPGQVKTGHALTAPP
jgi:hypothetical protein